MNQPRLNRANMIERTAENWQPPAFTQGDSWVARGIAMARRFLDLQAGSIWRDLSTLLPQCSGRVLDVGCGAQPYRSLLPPTVSYQGIDRADAKEHFGYEIPDTIYYDSLTWPIEDQSVDVVLCTETLEHVLDPRQFLAELARCLRPSGTAILTVPFAARWHYIPYDYWRYTPSGLQHLLNTTGLDSVQVYARGNAVSVACLKVMALFVPWLMPQSKSFPVSLLLRCLGLLMLPLLLIMGAVAQLSFQCGSGDDCLGYTIVASKRSEQSGNVTATVNQTTR